ncbi:MAG: anhydro-N-acetylmuramic acid kinase [Neptuniibacter sp.]
MSTEHSIYIGLMSGTSLDSIDAVAVRFQPEFQLIASHTEEIPESLKTAIRQLMYPGNNEIDQLGVIDIQLGQLLATAVNNLINTSQLDRPQIRAIGSHGQTIRHRPESGFTLQIGDPNIIAEHTNITTIADFRRRDMAAGGQGAPLVPAFHEAMLRDPRTDRILLNIGGMANITFLPKDSNIPVSGFDTGPGNILLNTWIEKHTGASFDNNGEWASKGRVNQKLLDALLNHEFFHTAPPKSTGREQFNMEWLETVLAKFTGITDTDVQATLTELTAISIKESIEQFIPSNNYELYVCGGGSHNSYLLQRLDESLPGITVKPSNKAGIDADWMEACAFAWLAKQCLEGNNGNISNVTGATNDRVLGAIYHA